MQQRIDLLRGVPALCPLGLEALTRLAQGAMAFMTLVLYRVFLQGWLGETHFGLGGFRAGVGLGRGRCPSLRGKNCREFEEKIRRG